MLVVLLQVGLVDTCYFCICNAALHRLELFFAQHTLLGVPKRDHTALVTKNAVSIVDDEHAVDLVRSDVAAVHNFVPDIVKHVEVTLIVRQNEIIMSQARGCDPLIVNLGQVGDFSPAVMLERLPVDGCMIIDDSLEAILADEYSVFAERDDMRDCNGFQKLTRLGKKVLVSVSVRNTVVLAPLKLVWHVLLVEL